MLLLYYVIDAEDSKYLNLEDLIKHVLPPQDPNEEFTKLQKLEEKEEQLRKKTEEKIF